MPHFNDLDLKKWKDSEIWTDSLWLISERDKSGKHDGSYHGNFVPQIPRQLMLRYSKEGDTVLDPFIGGGTTAYEAENLKRNVIGVDIQKDLIEKIKNNIDSKDIFAEFIVGDSTEKNTFEKIKEILKSKKEESVQLAILHPPYADIIKFSSLEKDLSNSGSLKGFLQKFALVLKNVHIVLEQGRHLAIIIGDKYTSGQWVPLGFYCMNEAQKLGFTLKSIIVKNMEGNRAKNNKQAIWRYRALSSDYYIFKHEYIFIFKK